MAILLALLALPATAQQPARDLFGAVELPTAAPPSPTGSYAKGCLAGGVALPEDGANWQAMRLSRNRHWGDPALVDYLEWLAGKAPAEGWNGLLVGDMSQPRGGPMKGGHASHQTGLDADIWLTPMPGHTLSAKERESLSATSMLIAGTRKVDPKLFTETEARFIRLAALHPDVARIFVAAGIKEAMCAIKWGDRGFLRKVRPWYGHDDHIHVRLSCPAGAADCADQAPPPEGDGCGKELAYWKDFNTDRFRPGTSGEAELRRLLLSSMRLV